MYLDGETVQTDLKGAQTFGLPLRSEGKNVFYIPGCSTMHAELRARNDGAGMGLLFVTKVEAAAPCAGHISQHKPRNVGSDIVGQDMDTIQDQGCRLIAAYENDPPYSWEEAGKPRGIDIEIARIMAQDLGVEARFKSVPVAENLEADLRNNIWKGALIGGRIANVMMRVPYDSASNCRVEQVVFTSQNSSESIAIALDKASDPEEKPVPAYFRFDAVALENDSVCRPLQVGNWPVGSRGFPK